MSNPDHPNREITKMLDKDVSLYDAVSIHRRHWPLNADVHIHDASHIMLGLAVEKPEKLDIGFDYQCTVASEVYADAIENMIRIAAVGEGGFYPEHFISEERFVSIVTESKPNYVTMSEADQNLDKITDDKIRALYRRLEPALKYMRHSMTEVNIPPGNQVEFLLKNVFIKELYELIDTDAGPAPDRYPEYSL